MGLRETLQKLEKQFGKGVVVRLGEEEVSKVEVISTGLASLDAALGVGGYPRGRVIELIGQEAGGKTTLALMAVAEVQKAGLKAAYVDAEHSLDTVNAKAMGVQTDDLLLCQPDNGEQGLEVAEGLILSNEIGIVVIDSVAALVPKAEIEGEMGGALPGLQARMMGQAMRKLTAITARSNTILLFINQIREKIGVMFGSPETTPGGKALKFYASVRLDIRRIATLKDGDRAYGIRSRIKVIKNKVAAPFRETEADLLFGFGFSKEGDLLDLAVARSVVERSGSWYLWGKEKLGQGRGKARDFLIGNPEVFSNLRQAVTNGV